MGVVVQENRPGAGIDTYWAEVTNVSMTANPEQLKALSIRQPWVELIKSRAEMTDEIVVAKARAASLWCQRAAEHAVGKPWKYLLIPQYVIDESKILAGLATTWEFNG